MPAFKWRSALHLVLPKWVCYFPILSIMSCSTKSGNVTVQRWLKHLVQVSVVPGKILHELNQIHRMNSNGPGVKTPIRTGCFCLLYTTAWHIWNLCTFHVSSLCSKYLKVLWNHWYISFKVNCLLADSTIAYTGGNAQ